jgi:hypothetical protein
VIFETSVTISKSERRNVTSGLKSSDGYLTLRKSQIISAYDILKIFGLFLYSVKEPDKDYMAVRVSVCL